MESYLVWIFLGCFALAAAAIAALVYRLMNAVTRSAYEPWRRYAETRGAVYRAPTNDVRPAITVTVDGTAFEVTHAPTLEGELARLAVRGRAPRALPMQLRVYNDSSLSGVGTMHGLPLVETGDAPFDREFLAKSDDPERARATVDASLRERLQRFPRRPLALTYDRGEVELLWEPAGFDGAHVDAAVAILAGLCARRDATAQRAH